MHKRLGILLILALSFSSCKLYRNIDMEELPFVPTVEDFANRYEVPIGSIPEFESNSLLKLADDTYIFEYMFDNTDSEEPVVGVLYQYFVEKEASIIGAMAMMNKNKLDYIETFRENGMDVREIEELDLAWPLHYCGEFFYPEGDVVGTLLVAMKGSMVLTMYINVDREDYPGLVEDFFNDFLKKTKVGDEAANWQGGATI